MAAAVGALGGPAAGARASGCAHSRLPPHAALPFVGSFLGTATSIYIEDADTIFFQAARIGHATVSLAISFFVLSGVSLTLSLCVLSD